MIRRLPLVCLLIALARMLTGQLGLSRQLCGSGVEFEKGKTFVIFRNIRMKNASLEMEHDWFTVSFKFARLSHKANKIASLIPMLIIAGYPGFIQKLYAVDQYTGYWQGIYQWKSPEHLEAYKKSTIFRIMNKRAAKGTISSYVFKDTNIYNYLHPGSNLK